MPLEYDSENYLGQYALKNKWNFARLDRALPLFVYFHRWSNHDQIKVL